MARSSFNFVLCCACVVVLQTTGCRTKAGTVAPVSAADSIAFANAERDSSTLSIGVATIVQPAPPPPIELVPAPRERPSPQPTSPRPSAPPPTPVAPPPAAATPPPALAPRPEARPIDLVPVAAWLTPERTTSKQASNDPAKPGSRRAVVQLLREKGLHPTLDEGGLSVSESELARAREVLLTDPRAANHDLVVVMLIPAGSARQSVNGLLLPSLTPPPMPLLPPTTAPTTEPSNAETGAVQRAG